jgi:hypothetical protein
LARGGSAMWARRNRSASGSTRRCAPARRGVVATVNHLKAQYAIEADSARLFAKAAAGKVLAPSLLAPLAGGVPPALDPAQASLAAAGA